MKFKKLTALAVCIASSVGTMFADWNFRDHRYESFKATPADNVEVMFVGNSITNMHEWWESFGSIQAISGRGNSGGMTAEILNNLESYIDGKPGKLFLMIGTNDIRTDGSEATAALIARQIRTIAKRIQIESPETEIFVQSILPRRNMNGSIPKANELIRGFCNELGVNYIDLTETLALLPNDNAWSNDGLHPQPKGYSAWTHYIENQVGYNSVYVPHEEMTSYKNAGTGSSHAMRIGQFSYLPISEGDILLFGDELIHSGEWHELLGSPKVKDRGTGWGTGGINLVQGKATITATLEDRNVQPAAIIINYGEGGKDATNYRLIIDAAKRLAPNAKIFCMSLPPRANTDDSDSANATFNNDVIQAAAQEKGAAFIDIYTPLAADRTKNIMNGSYITGRGYAVIATEIAKALNDPTLNPVSVETAEALIERRNTRAIVGNKLTEALMLDVAAERQPALDAAISEAAAAISNDMTRAQANAAAAKLQQAIFEAKGFTTPLMSTDAETHWYIVRSLRASRVATSLNGKLVGLTEAPNAQTTPGHNVWKLVERPDGTFDFVNMLGKYVNADGVANNTGMNTTATQPNGGWALGASNHTDGTFVIYSDAANNAQWNQSNNGAFPVLNWHPAGTYPILTDEGSSYTFEEYFGHIEEPEHSTGWYRIAVESGINGLGDANHMINADEEKYQNATNYYALRYDTKQTEAPAKEFIHLTVNGNSYQFTGLNGHGIKENCTSDRNSLPSDNPAVTKKDDGTYSIGKWHIWVQEYKYVGKSSNSNNTFSIKQVSESDLSAYDIWSVEIIAANNAEVGKDVKVTLNNAENKGIATVFNGGTYFLTKGAEIKPEELTFTVQNEQTLTEPYVNIDNNAKKIRVNFNEVPVIEASAIVLSATEIALTEGESATLTATVEPADATDPTVCWTTSDSAVATVADGLITTVAAGECTVSASCGKATATCTVTVKAKEDDSSINEISATSTPDAYDLQGRRVANPANGLYIIGGKLIRK